MNRHALVRACSLLVCSTLFVPVFAQDVKGSESSAAPRLGCVPIPDNMYTSPTAGTTGMVCVAVPPGTGIVSGARLTFGADHTWVGDLTVKIVPPTGPTVTVFSEPGVPATAAGDSSNLAQANLLRFFDTFTDDPETMGNTIATGGIVCAPPPAGDGRCDYRTNPGPEVAGNLAALNGLSAAGNWQVCVGDGAALDTGQVCTATIEFQAGAPAAADLALTQSNDAAGNALLIGSTFQKTLTVTNNGPGAATAITVSDTLPAQLAFVSSNCGATAAGQVVTYTIATLANGASNSCILTVRVAASGTIMNTAAITASTPADPTPGNNTTTAQIGPTGGGIAQTPVTALDLKSVLVLLGLVSALGMLALRQRQA